MTELLNKTLAQIVTEKHQAASIFEKHHLDFCCKGKRPLSEAIAEKHLSAEQVVNELEEVFAKNVNNDAALFNYIHLSQLCDYIVSTHHAYVKQNLPQINAYLEKVATKHGNRHPELIEIFKLFTELKEELTEHLFKEENILFPRIKEIEQKFTGRRSFSLPVEGYIEAPVSVMELEHDKAGDLLEQIRNRTNNYTPPVDACTTYLVAFASLQAFEADLHQHVHLENNILFPKALRMVEQLSSPSPN
jgi:regulator of cell morphogenesis and NO signaling